MKKPNIKYPFTYAKFKAIYSKVPRLTVDLVIKKDGKTLLILRRKYGWEGLWHTPGGTVYYQETVEKAVARVAREEAGMKVVIKKFLGFADHVDEAKVRGFGHTVALVFLCEPKSEPRKSEDIKYFKKLPANTIPIINRLVSAT